MLFVGDVTSATGFYCEKIGTSDFLYGEPPLYGIETSDVRGLFAEVAARRAKVVQPLTVQPWGGLTSMVATPMATLSPSSNKSDGYADRRFADRVRP